MPLVAGKILTNGILYFLQDAKTKVKHKISYEKIKRIGATFKHSESIRDESGVIPGWTVLCTDAYICCPDPDVEHSILISAKDYFLFKSYLPDYPVHRFIASYAKEERSGHYIDNDLSASIRVNPETCQNLITAEYVIIATKMSYCEVTTSEFEEVSAMCPLTYEDYLSYAAYQDKIAEELPPSMRF